jgi:hypothetical protein
MYKCGLLLMASLVAGSAHAQEVVAISSPALSRCAGKVGAETRAADPAFASLSATADAALAARRNGASAIVGRG